VIPFGRALAAATALLVPAIHAAAPRMALALEGTVSHYPQPPELAVGGTLAGRIGWAEAILVADWATRSPAGVAGYERSALVGAGLALDASPLVSLHPCACGRSPAYGSPCCGSSPARTGCAASGGGARPRS
jgi:hypothetical protein